VQGFRGHSKLTTTARYLHAKARPEDLERLNRAFMARVVDVFEPTPSCSRLLTRFSASRKLPRLQAEVPRRPKTIQDVLQDVPRRERRPADCATVALRTREPSRTRDGRDWFPSSADARRRDYRGRGV
jgi:hypothetical protein